VPSERHVSRERRRLTEIASARLKEIGWTLNERTLNASRFAGTCTLVVYYDRNRRHEVGLVRPYAKSRSVSLMGFITVAISMDEAHKTVTQAQAILSDLHRWIVEDPLEAMAVLGMSEDKDAV
jgi:hypothetical protein